MSPGDGWYLFGPLMAVGLAGFLGAAHWRQGLERTLGSGLESAYDADGLAIFGQSDDYGLLWPAAVTDQPEVADEIRRLLVDAGIRATHAVNDDGRVAVLVFVEEVEEARRLVGDSPAL